MAEWIGIFFLQFIIFSVITIKTDELWFNIKRNYEKWYLLNWLGVIMVTVIYWIAVFPFALIWLFVKAITIGREEE